MTKKRITSRRIESQSYEMAKLKDQVKDEHKAEMFRPFDIVWDGGTICLFEIMTTHEVVGFTFVYGRFGRKGFCTYSLITHTFAFHSSQAVAKKWVRQEMLKVEGES